MRYLIWSNEHRGWWKANRHGYTTRTDKAGQFSFEESQPDLRERQPLRSADFKAAIDRHQRSDGGSAVARSDRT